MERSVTNLTKSEKYLEQVSYRSGEISDYLNIEETALRRFFDVTISVILLTFLMPIFAIIALLIKLTSKGPILFVQERLGKNKKPFRLYKFRTMVPNAERKTGPVWAKEDDPRVTTVGHYLRESRLDELPQLFNVIKGDMTLVGCRPIRKHFADILAEEIDMYDLRFKLKPGITGLAQIKESYANSMEAQEEKFHHELFYLVNRNPKLDAKILFKTLFVPFKRMGA